MACFSVATTSVQTKVILSADVAERLGQAIEPNTQVTVRESEYFITVNTPNFAITVDKGTGRVSLRDYSSVVTDPELQEKFEKLVLQAQKATILQKLQAAGKVSEVRQVKGGTTLKVRV